MTLVLITWSTTRSTPADNICKLQSTSELAFSKTKFIISHDHSNENNVGINQLDASAEKCLK